MDREFKKQLGKHDGKFGEQQIFARNGKFYIAVKVGQRWMYARLFEGMEDVDIVRDLVVGGNVKITGTVKKSNNNLFEGHSTGRNVFRVGQIQIENGTDANTIKCTCSSRFNGDVIAVTDNIVKNATTGNFTLNAAGNRITIKASGLTGNCIGTGLATILQNASGTDFRVNIAALTNDFWLNFTNPTTAAAVDLTVLVDTGIIYIGYVYITNG